MAHTIDTSLYATGSSNPQTFDYTCGVGTTLLVLSITVDAATKRFVTAAYAPNFGGNIMQVVDGSSQTGASAESHSEMWYVLNPSTQAAYTISVPNTSKTLYLRAASFKAASQSTSVFNASVGGYNTTANPSLNITTTAAAVAVLNMSNGGNNLPTVFYPDSITGGTAGAELLSADLGNHTYTGRYYFLGSGATYKVGGVAAADDWTIVSGAWTEAGAVPFVPTLTTPTHNSTNVSIGTSTLTWAAANAGPTAASYVVQLCKNTDFIVNDVSIAGVTTTYYGSVPTLTYTTDYYWRVKATNATGDSNFTGNFKFTTGSATSVKSIGNVEYGSMKSVSNVVKASIKSISNVV